MRLNIDMECVSVLSLIIQDSPRENDYILCVLARSNAIPSRIAFNPNTEYPTFYSYSNSRIPLYLLGKGVLNNIPRQGYARRLITSQHLAYAETSINVAKNWGFSQKLETVSRFITLENRTAYKDAEVYLVFRDKALTFIKNYGAQNKDELSRFLGPELSKLAFGTVDGEAIASQPNVSKTLDTRGDQLVDTYKLPNKRDMAKEVVRLKKVCSLGKKEAKLLTILSSFEPISTRELITAVPTKAYKRLKATLGKKIEKEGWGIKTDKGKGLNPISFYSLVRSTPTEIR